MHNLFSYESKFMQILLKLADMIILNMLFLLCCIPIITIGAAQAGLYSGIRQLMNKEDDNSCVKAFFKGFASGFGKITLVHTCFLLLTAVLVYTLYALLVLQQAGLQAPVWVCIFALAMCLLLQSVIPPFHACFDCTCWQLVRNMVYLLMAHFFRYLLSAVFIWLPIGVALLDLFVFMRAFPIWTLLYYSFAYLMVYTFMNKPFTDLKQDFLDAQKAPAASEAAEEQITEE